MPGGLAVTRDALDVLVDAARDALAADLLRERRWLAPDFAAALAEAHARDPRRVPADALAEAHALAPVLDLQSDAQLRVSRRAQVQFAMLLAEARDTLDDDLERVREAGPPPLRLPALRPAPSGHWLWLTAAAALVALALGARPLLGRGELAGPASNQAPWSGQSAPPRPTTVPADRTRTSHVPASPLAATTSHVPADTLPTADSPVPADMTRASPVPASPLPAAASPVPADTLPAKALRPVPRARLSAPAARLARLAAEAEARWQDGDLVGAEARYREIVALAPGGRAADLAYGDLFALARLRRGQDHELALWREYLRAHPRGRYADDAHAGLCRRAALDARPGCWRAYRDEFPDGLHLQQARRTLAEADE